MRLHEKKLLHCNEKCHINDILMACVVNFDVRPMIILVQDDERNRYLTGQLCLESRQWK